jgi:hypothetical protein
MKFQSCNVLFVSKYMTHAGCGSLILRLAECNSEVGSAVRVVVYTHFFTRFVIVVCFLDGRDRELL